MHGGNGDLTDPKVQIKTLETFAKCTLWTSTSSLESNYLSSTFTVSKKNSLSNSEFSVQLPSTTRCKQFAKS